MKWRLRFMFVMASIPAMMGCAAYQAYPGPRRPLSEVAVLNAPSADLVLDGEHIPKRRARAVAMLPGWHEIEWQFEFPNRFRQTQSLEFRVEAGERYRLGQRFFPAPHPHGPLGQFADLTLGVLTFPIAVFIPTEPPAEAPPGEFFHWIVHVDSRRVIAGWAPDVGGSHEIITYVPVDE